MSRFLGNVFRHASELLLRPIEPLERRFDTRRSNSGDGMEADEFNRKYHPFPALLNLMSSSPKDSTVGLKSLSLPGNPFDKHSPNRVFTDRICPEM